MGTKKNDARAQVRLVNPESGYTYTSEKNKRNSQQKLEIRKYDPILRRHAKFVEKKV